jgi:uncharacterized protein YqfB (UPF0267 family)
MSMPYWTAKLFNDKIRAGQIGNRKLEDSLRTWTLSGVSFKHIVCVKHNTPLRVSAKLDSICSIQMDTTSSKFISTIIQSDTLYLIFDEKKYTEHMRSQSKEMNSEFQTDEAVAVATNSGDDYYNSYDVGYEIKVSIRELNSLNLKNTNMSLDMYPGNKVVNNWFIKIDSSQLNISYNEEVLESLGNYSPQTYNFPYQFKVEKNNQSYITWSNFLPSNMTIILNDDYFSFEKYYKEVEYHPTVIMDKNSDIQLNLSMLDKIRIVKKY